MSCHAGTRAWLHLVTDSLLYPTSPAAYCHRRCRRPRPLQRNNHMVNARMCNYQIYKGNSDWHRSHKSIHHTHHMDFEALGSLLNRQEPVGAGNGCLGAKHCRKADGDPSYYFHGGSALSKTRRQHRTDPRPRAGNNNTTLELSCMPHGSHMRYSL